MDGEPEAKKLRMDEAEGAEGEDLGGAAEWGMDEETVAGLQQAEEEQQKLNKVCVCRGVGQNTSVPTGVGEVQGLGLVFAGHLHSVAGVLHLAGRGCSQSGYCEAVDKSETSTPCLQTCCSCFAIELGPTMEGGRTFQSTRDSNNYTTVKMQLIL